MKFEWTQVQLSDVCDLVAGFAFKSSHFGNYSNKVIKIADITPPTVSMNGLIGIDLSKYDPCKLDRFVAGPGDYVLAMTGATIGKIGRIEHGEAYINQRVLLFKNQKEKIDKDFLYYVLQQYRFRQYILSHIDSESAQPNISAGTIGKFCFALPQMEIQQSIGGFLRIFDEKIELNRKINENLERQAQAIYTAMFADNFEKMSTTPGTLGDIANITMGQSPNGSSYNEEGIGDVFYQGRAEFGFRFPTRRLYTTEPKRFAEAGDVLISVRAPVGDLNVAFERCCIGRGLGAVHSKSDNNSFILYTMRALKPQLDVFNGEGTVFGSINRDALNSMPLNIPSPEAITHFESVVQPIDELIRVNYEEIFHLQTLRDTLLPKLMAGEIDI